MSYLKYFILKRIQRTRLGIWFLGNIPFPHLTDVKTTRGRVIVELIQRKSQIVIEIEIGRGRRDAAYVSEQASQTKCDVRFCAGSAIHQGRRLVSKSHINNLAVKMISG